MHMRTITQSIISILIYTQKHTNEITHHNDIDMK